MFFFIYYMLCFFFFFFLSFVYFLFFFFFFQAEDGIRDRNVTGVQTCALPIYLWGATLALLSVASLAWSPLLVAVPMLVATLAVSLALAAAGAGGTSSVVEIGRASCREKVWVSEVDGSLKKKKRKKELRVWVIT